MNDYIEPTWTVPHNGKVCGCVETAINVKLCNMNDVLCDKCKKC
jgi:hypothetical protein